MESISCADTHYSCDWCGACPYEECQQPDLRLTKAARKPLQIEDAPMELLPDPPGLEEVIHGPLSKDTFGGLDDEEALHFDTGKLDMTLIDPGFMRSMAEALGYGANKYGVDNWRKGSSYRRYMASTLRHIQAFLEREDLDDESGCEHLAHAACNIMFVMAWQHAGIGKDDRFQPM